MQTARVYRFVNSSHWNALYHWSQIIPTGGTALGNAYYGQGTGTILLDRVGCVGTEARLWDCTNRGIGVHSCTHSEDASVQCSSKLLFMIYNQIIGH